MEKGTAAHPQLFGSAHFALGWKRLMSCYNGVRVRSLAFSKRMLVYAA